MTSLNLTEKNESNKMDEAIVENEVKKAKKVKLKSVENLSVAVSKANETKVSSLSGSMASVKSERCWNNYSYVVLLASFVAYMLASLLSSCFGVFFESMDADLEWSKSKVAFIGALLTALQDLTGPVSSALTNRYGCRKTAIFGGLIASLGIIGSAYVQQFWLFGLLMGGVSGFGTSLVLVSSVVVVTYYFEDKPSLAAGLTISGASFGQSIFTMIIIKLNDEYGRSGAFLILGGILLNMIVCGALFRPLKWELDEEDEDDDEDEDEDDEDDEDDEEASEKSSKEHDLKEIEPAPIVVVADVKEIDETEVYEPKALSDLVMSIVRSRSKFTSDSYLHGNKRSLEMPSLGQSATSIASYDLHKKVNLGSRAASLDKPFFPSGRLLNSNKLLNSDFFAPTDTQSLKSFRSNKPNTLDNRSTYSLIGEDEQGERRAALHGDDNDDDDDDFFVVDMNELADCDPDLVITSPIYLPFLGDAEHSNFAKNSLNQSNLSIKSLKLNNEEAETNKENKETSKAIGTKKEEKQKGKLATYLNKFTSLFSQGNEASTVELKNTTTSQNNNNATATTANSTAPLKPTGVSKKPALPNSNHQPQLILKQMGKTTANKPRYVIASCNCRQRHIQALSRKKPASKQRSLFMQPEAQNQTVPNNEGVVKPSANAADAMNEKGKGEKLATRQRVFRHYPNCPINILKKSLKNTYQASHLNVQRRPNFHYVPSLFQNSYRFPLHFKNVYYYKSLVNLNMRLMNLKSSQNRPVRLAGVLNPTDAKNTTNTTNNNVSFSCPNLNLKQVLVVDSSKSGIKLAPFAGGDMNLVTFRDWRILGEKPKRAVSRPESGSKVLNAGSIVFTPSMLDSSSKLRRDSILAKKREEADIIKSKTESDANKTNTLLDFNEKNGGKDQSKEKLLSKKVEEEDDEEEEDEEEDEDEDDDEECDNCFTRTKFGNYMYRFLWRPTVKPLKFIFYSACESVKLFLLFKFSVFALCNFMLSFFYESPFYFINSYMIENGSSQNQAGTVTVAVGIVSVFSSIAYGYIGDSKRVNSILLYSVSLVLCGICSCLIPVFISNYLVTMTLMILIGALISVSDVLVPVICVNLVGYDDFVNAYGLMFFCQGLASLTGPPLLGMIVDYTGKYSISYYMIGIGIIISGLILSLIFFYNICEKNKDTKKNSIENKNKLAKV